MLKPHSPFIRIQITEVKETLGDKLRETSFKLVERDFQTREGAIEWMNSQDSIRSFSEDVADAVNINI